ncbi:hypothetical protein YC2023_083923 [Brassica napus]
MTAAAVWPETRECVPKREEVSEDDDARSCVSILPKQIVEPPKGKRVQPTLRCKWSVKVRVDDVIWKYKHSLARSNYSSPYHSSAAYHNNLK